MPLSNQLYNRKHLLGWLFGALLYFIWFYFFVGLRSEHVWLFGLIVFLYFFRTSTRRFVVYFAPFIIFWIVYDSMRVIPNYTINDIHIKELYDTEKSLFGIEEQGKILTPNEYFKLHTTSFFDVLTGLFYLGWVPVPLLFGAWLYTYNLSIFKQFAYTFLFTNIFGFCLYYIYPAAPPWYVELYGFDVHYGTSGNAAGMINFDKYFKIDLFKNMYQKNANVFAAMPSLHSAYPLLCFLFSLQFRKPFLTIFMSMFCIGVWFAAVYSRHHYVLDVIAGIATALTCYWFFKKYWK